MKKIILTALLLAGCTTQGAIEAALPKYQDKPVSLVFQRWGVADRSIAVDGGAIYQWRAQDRAGVCRLEAHADDRGKLIGIRGVGTDSVCAAWYRML